MNRIRIAVFMASLNLTITSVSLAQATPESLDLRKAINDSCLASKVAKLEVDKVEELEIPAKDRVISARVYRTTSTTPLPILVFIHGGGFVAGNLDTHDNVCRYLCSRISCVVLSIDYRLAPENKFPAQQNDCFEATNWATKNAVRFGGDPERVAVIGDSAGGMLAAALCHEAREQGGPELCAQVLVNPDLDFANIDGKRFESNRLFRDYYLADLKEKTTKNASPLLAENFADLPPALVLVAERDSRREQGEAYVEKLRAGGVPANAYCQYGVDHLGPIWATASPVAQEPMDVAVGFLKAAFAKPIN